MAWEKGYQHEVKVEDSLKEAWALEGDLQEEEARIMLFKLLRDNIGFTWELLSGEKLFEFQEILLNGWMRKDYSLTVAGRGVGKSYLLAIFAMLFAAFTTKARIVIVANNFRRVKDIFSQIAKFMKSKDAILLKQCFSDQITKANDVHIIRCFNGSEIIGLPLSGDGIRGQRANLLIIDEGLLISQNIQETILRPFLSSKLAVKEQDETRTQEDFLIAEGKMTEDERTIFQNNKLLVTSSASYKFEYLYDGIYKPYLANIMDEHKERQKTDPSYFVTRLSYDSLPPNSIMDESAVAAAKGSNGENPIFLREWCARFVDGSDGYFNVKKLHDCTVEDGKKPTCEVRGGRDSKYILAIDPAYSASAAGDYFAMGVYLLDDIERRIIQVNSYGYAGKSLVEHYQYLIYILQNFNIELISIDASGVEFIAGFNESTWAKDRKINLSFISAEFDEDNYETQLNIARREINKESGKIVYAQKFSSFHNRKMNEHLQNSVAASKIWFASRLAVHETEYKKAVEFQLPFTFTDENNEPYSMGSFIDNIDDGIAGTKKQMALIEVSASANGNLSYNLPSRLKSGGVTRARKDNYTTLMLGCLLAKAYWDMREIKEDDSVQSFEPMFF